MNVRNKIKNGKLAKIAKPTYKMYQRLKFALLDLWIKNMGISNGKKRLKLLTNKQANNLLSSMINSNKPFMVARYGGTEFSVMTNIGNQKYEQYNLNMVAGVFPKNEKTIKRFRKEYFESSKYLDVLAVWLYKYHFSAKRRVLKKTSNLKHLISLEDLDPLKNNWINSLKDKRVLVVHPFKKSIEFQYKKSLDIIPKFKSLNVVKAVQSAGDEDSDFKDWFEALEYMKREINKNKNKFDVALIGCGAYGFPLAAHVKKMGKQAIHMGGVLQLLFGIKGKRWEESEGIKFPKNWIYPLSEDTPKNVKKIEKAEGGCYW